MPKPKPKPKPNPKDDPYDKRIKNSIVNRKYTRDKEINQKRKIKIGINNVDKPFHSGTCKEAYEPVLKPEYPVFSVFEHEFRADDFVILRYADKDISCPFSNIYIELEYYNKFGKAGFSPVVSQILIVLSVSVLLKAKLSRITNNEYADEILKSLQNDDDDDITFAYQQVDAIVPEIHEIFSNGYSAETFNELLQKYKKHQPEQPIQDYRQFLDFTPDEFLSHFRDENVEKPDSSADVWVLMEKANCGNKILKIYENNYRQMFIDLRIFLKRFVERFGLINADIKLDNLCIGKDGQFIMIDFDPGYILDIRNSGIEIKYFIDYMLFQTYTNIIIWHGRNIIIYIPIIFSKYYINKMVTEIEKFKKKNLIDALFSHSLSTALDNTETVTDPKRIQIIIYDKLEKHGVSTVEPIEFEPIEFEPPGPNIFSRLGSSLHSLFFLPKGGKKTKRNNKKRSKKNRSRRF
jgi:hypothetical protein